MERWIKNVNEHKKVHLCSTYGLQYGLSRKEEYKYCLQKHGNWSKNAFTFVEDQKGINLNLKMCELKGLHITLFFFSNELVTLIRPQNSGLWVLEVFSGISKITGIHLGHNLCRTHFGIELLKGQKSKHV